MSARTQIDTKQPQSDAPLVVSIPQGFSTKTAMQALGGVLGVQVALPPHAQAQLLPVSITGYDFTDFVFVMTLALLLIFLAVPAVFKDTLKGKNTNKFVNGDLEDDA